MIGRKAFHYDLLFLVLAENCRHSNISFNHWERSSGVEGKELEFSGSEKVSAGNFGSWRIIARFTRIFFQLTLLELVLGFDVVISTAYGISSSPESVAVSVSLVWMLSFSYKRLHKRRNVSNSSLRMVVKYFRISLQYSYRLFDVSQIHGHSKTNGNSWKVVDDMILGIWVVYSVLHRMGNVVLPRNHFIANNMSIFTVIFRIEQCLL